MADDSLSRFVFDGGVDNVGFVNSTSSPNIYAPMIIFGFNSKRFGLAINFENKTVMCVNYVDRSKDFVIKA